MDTAPENYQGVFMFKKKLFFPSIQQRVTVSSNTFKRLFLKMLLTGKIPSPSPVQPSLQRTLLICSSSECSQTKSP